MKLALPIAIARGPSLRPSTLLLALERNREPNLPTRPIGRKTGFDILQEADCPLARETPTKQGTVVSETLVAAHLAAPTRREKLRDFGVRHEVARRLAIAM
jgi:hypothetical protein